jgi:hypothetical protein
MRACVAIAVSLAYMSACHHAPRPVPPPQVVVAKRPMCNLPAIPTPVNPPVGWPTPETILISKSDFVEMIQYVDGLRAWIEAAAVCL